MPSQLITVKGKHKGFFLVFITHHLHFSQIFWSIVFSSNIKAGLAGVAIITWVGEQNLKKPADSSDWRQKL